MLAVSWLNSQIVFDGIVQGLAVSVIAVGVVLVYRATRIINFAVGNMGVVGAAILSLLVVQYHVPYWLGFYGTQQDLRCRVLDAVRRRIEGARASALFEQWLAA